MEGCAELFVQSLPTVKFLIDNLERIPHGNEEGHLRFM